MTIIVIFLFWLFCLNPILPCLHPTYVAPFAVQRTRLCERLWSLVVPWLDAKGRSTEALKILEGRVRRLAGYEEVLGPWVGRGVGFGMFGMFRCSQVRGLFFGWFFMDLRMPSRDSWWISRMLNGLWWILNLNSGLRGNLSTVGWVMINQHQSS